MNQIFRSAGVVVLGVGLFAYGQVLSGQHFERVTEHYNLDPAQVEFTKSCMSSLSSHGKEFEGGAEASTGCGCIASKLASANDAETRVDYKKMSRAFGSIVKFSESNDSKNVDLAGMIKDLSDQGLDYAESMTVIAEIGQTTGICKSARLPKASTKKALEASSVKIPHQPTVVDAPSGKKGCEGLSPSSVATLQKIADRDGKTLEEMCANVVS